MIFFHERQRVLVSWGDVSYAARVIEIRTELGRRGESEQSYLLVKYEIDGQRLWHEPSEVLPLDESAVVAAPDDADDECVVQEDERWQALSLRCLYLLKPSRIMWLIFVVL